MNNFVVGIDADGVLVNMSEFNIREGKKYFKKEPVNLNAYHTRDIFGVSKKEEFIYGLKGALNKYCKKEPPMPNCKEVIKKLNEEGIVLHEITARKFTTFDNIIGKYYRKLFEKWLHKHELKFKTIEYCSETDSPRDKLLGCRKLNVDVMIEDKPDVAEYLANNDVKILLMDAPYNKDLMHPNITRVYNWEEIYDNIIKLKKAKHKFENFEIKSKEQKASMTDEEKVKYFNDYHHYLKNLKINEKAIKRGNRRFKIAYNIMKLPIKMIYNPKVSGKENIPYQNGFIVASNHLNSNDQYLISSALGNRHFSGFAASTIEDTFRAKLFKYIEGAVFIDRQDSESKKRCEEELSKRVVNGDIALIFPEGTRKNKTEEGRKKEQLPFKFGTVSMSQKTGTAILPVSIYYGKKQNYVKFGELFYVRPEEELSKKNIELERIILNMTRESIIEDNKLSKQKKITK